MSRRTRRLGLRTALLIGGLALGLGVAEVAVRLVRPQTVLITPAGMYEPDPPGRYRLRAGFHGVITNRTEFTQDVDINAAGLRGAELPPGSDPRVRILAVGDSYTFGWGVREEEAFGARLASLVSADGTPALALNGGTPGFNLVDEVSWIERHAPALKPDLIVLGVYEGNDVQDSDPEAAGVELRGGLVYGADTRHGVFEWLYYHSHLFALAKGSLHGPVESRLRAWLGLREPFATRNLRAEAAIYARTPPAALVRGRAACDSALARLTALTEAHDLPVIALLIPHVVQVDPGRFDAALRGLGLDPAAYDPAAPTRLLIDLLEAHDVPVVDPGPELARRIAAGERMYFPVDRHWTAAAHEVAARQLLGRLPFRMEGQRARRVVLRRAPWNATVPAASATPAGSPAEATP